MWKVLYKRTWNFKSESLRLPILGKRDRLMKKYLGMFACVALLLVACAEKTEVQSVWKDETRTGKINKVFVLAVVEDPTIRRSVEYGIVNLLNREKLRAIPTLDSFPDIADIDKTLAHKMMKEFAIDSVLLIRLVDRKVEKTYVGGTSYYDGFYRNRYAGGWHNYYGHGYNVFRTPGYIIENYISTAETVIFDIDSDKVLWSTVTETRENVVPEAISSYLKTIDTSLVESGLF